VVEREGVPAAGLGGYGRGWPLFGGKELGDIRVGVRYDRAHVCIYLVL
jgi:hypothetical protein